MDKEDYNNFYHVDISTQINNKWKNDSVLGIVKNSKRYSIKIKGGDKEKIKRRFITNKDSWHEKIHNRKVIAIIYSYLLHKALCEFQEAKPLLLCRDVRPEKFVMSYFQKIAAFFKNYSISNREIKFRKRIEFKTKERLPKSLAGKYARKVYQGKLPANKRVLTLGQDPRPNGLTNPLPRAKGISINKILSSSEIKELIEIIGRIL